MTPTSFKTRFPQFAAEDDDRIQFFIDDADPFFDVCRWGGFYEVGIANFVAHELVVANADAAAAAAGGASAGMSNNTTTKKVDMVQVTRDATLLQAEANDPYMRTVYGQRYVELRDQVGMGAVAV